MKKYLIIFSLIFTGISFAQFSARAGMGISFASTPSVKDYINQNFASPDNQLGSFNSAINFSGEVDYDISGSYQLGVEVAYLLNSYEYSGTGSKYTFDYNIIMPSVMNYYVIKGSGYNFKFGGGIGLRFVSVDESIVINTPANYTSTGFGFLFRADGNTALGGNFYANVGGDIRYDLNGEPESDSGNKLGGSYGAVNLNSLSVGVRLGITYYF